jgi:hypothetical protein
MNKGHRRFWLLLLLVGPALPLLVGRMAWAEEAKVAIAGYDTVAYFDEGRPVQGQQNIEYQWHNLRWRFASIAHRDLFARDPDRYAPQFDGYCAMGVASEDSHKDIVDPQAWIIVDGKLYMAFDRKALDKFRAHLAANIQSANEHWPQIKDRQVLPFGPWLTPREAPAAPADGG